MRTGPLGAEPGITTVYLFCPDGLSPTGGGFASGGTDTTISMHSSFPFDDNIAPPGADSDTIPDNGWAVEVNNSGADTRIFAGYAVCGSASTVAEEFVTVSASVTTSQSPRGAYIARPDGSIGSTKSGR